MANNVNVQVTAMDSEWQLTISSKTIGRDVFDQVAKMIGIRETWFFGLKYKDRNGDDNWLRLDKKVLAHDLYKETPHKFQFRVRFYPEDVADELIMEVTQRLFFLQAMEDIRTEEIFCPLEIAFLLASLAIQALRGDFDHRKVVENPIMLQRFLPQRILEMYNLPPEQLVGKLYKFWSVHDGMDNVEAMMEYLKIAQELEMYGVSYFRVTNRKSTQLLLGIDAAGINIYQTANKLKPEVGLPWSEIRNISIDTSRPTSFTIKSTDKRSPVVTLKTENIRFTKCILALCLGNHEMYHRRRRVDTIEVQEMKQRAREAQEPKKPLRLAKEMKQQAEREIEELRRRKTQSEQAIGIFHY